jgi:hypothetical protein
MFTAPRGLNIRNNTVHGLLAPEEDQRNTALLALMGVLTACYALHLLRQGAAE